MYILRIISISVSRLFFYLFCMTHSLPRLLVLLESFAAFSSSSSFSHFSNRVQVHHIHRTRRPQTEQTVCADSTPPTFVAAAAAFHPLLNHVE